MAPIVAVDDDEDDRFFFSRLLRKAGVTAPVRTFASGEEATSALAQFRDGHPCGCFLDVKMPGMNGFDVLLWIRTQSIFDAMPVFMLSSSDDPSDLRRAEKLGAQAYFRKHPSEAEVAAVCGLLCSAARGTRVDWLACPPNLFRRKMPRRA